MSEIDTEHRNRIKNNVLIAEFMGATKNDSEWKIPNVSIPYQGFERYGDCEPCLKFTDKCQTYEMEYHKSWNWIMPVVEKIESLMFSFFIHNEGAYIKKTTYKVSFPHIGNTGENKI